MPCFPGHPVYDIISLSVVEWAVIYLLFILEVWVVDECLNGSIERPISYWIISKL